MGGCCFLCATFPIPVPYDVPCQYQSTAAETWSSYPLKYPDPASHTYTSLMAIFSLETLLHFAWVVGDAKCILVMRVCVCLRPHSHTTAWELGRGCPLVVHYCVDLQSVHRFRCYDNIARTWNVRNCLYSVYAWLAFLILIDDRCRICASVTKGCCSHLIAVVLSASSNSTPREGRWIHSSSLWDAMRKVSNGGQVTVDVCVCRWRSSSVFRIISSWSENSLSDSLTTLPTWQSTSSLPRHLISRCSRYVDTLTCDACQSSVYIINIMSCFVSFLSVVFQC